MIKFNKPYISGNEEKLISSAISESGIESDGQYTKLCQSFFQEKYGFNKCYLTPSCTSAIEMAMLTLDLQPEDEIIIPSYTFSTCPNPFIISKVKVVLADCDKNYPNISPEHVKELITPNTKAVMIMHYGGVACDMNEILALCKQHDLYLIEDAAQCIDAYYKNKPLGSFGDISVLSFHYTKNITCGEGGLIAINNLNLIEKANIAREYGTNRASFKQYNLPHYESVGLGLAFFQSEINAIFLYAQLQDIDVVSQNRKKLWDHYFNALKGLASGSTFKLPEINSNATSNNHTFFITVQNENDTNELIDYLAKNNISAVKHFYPLHQSKFHSGKQSNNDFPNATRFNNTLIRLPLHHYLTFKEINFIVEKISIFFNQE